MILIPKSRLNKHDFKINGHVLQNITSITEIFDAILTHKNPKCNARTYRVFINDQHKIWNVVYEFFHQNDPPNGKTLKEHNVTMSLKYKLYKYKSHKFLLKSRKQLAFCISEILPDDSLF